MNAEAEIRALRVALERLEKRAQAAEDYVAVSNLQRTYGYYVDKFQWEQVADLFARAGTLEINVPLQDLRGSVLFRVQRYELLLPYIPQAVWGDAEVVPRSPGPHLIPPSDWTGSGIHLQSGA